MMGGRLAGGELAHGPELRVDRPWGEYPTGTHALAIGGGHWIKTEGGWKWWCGDTFPAPGADAFRVRLPVIEAEDGMCCGGPDCKCYCDGCGEHLERCECPD